MLFVEAPSFAQRMEDRVAVVGSTAVMQCMTSGSPRPRLTWLKDGVVLVPTQRHFFTADDQLLVIVHATEKDAGNYTCVMTNVLGSDRQVRHSRTGTTLSYRYDTLVQVRHSYRYDTRTGTTLSYRYDTRTGTTLSYRYYTRTGTTLVQVRHSYR